MVTLPSSFINILALIGNDSGFPFLHLRFRFPLRDIAQFPFQLLCHLEASFAFNAYHFHSAAAVRHNDYPYLLLSQYFITSI
jgi:hypothetical protein